MHLVEEDILFFTQSSWKKPILSAMLERKAVYSEWLIFHIISFHILAVFIYWISDSLKHCSFGLPQSTFETHGIHCSLIQPPFFAWLTSMRKWEVVQKTAISMFPVGELHSPKWDHFRTEILQSTLRLFARILKIQRYKKIKYEPRLEPCTMFMWEGSSLVCVMT